MEESPNVFQSPNSSGSIQGSASKKVKRRLSEVRYTPNKTQEQNLSTFMLDICQDSLEFPKPKSKLIEFTEIRQGEEKPRQIIMPLFFHTIKSPSHQRQASLKPILKEKKNSTISEILMNLREKPKPKSSLKGSESSHKNKTVSFCSQVELNLHEEDLNNSVIFIDDGVDTKNYSNPIGKSTMPTTANSLVNDFPNEKMPETNTSTIQNLEVFDENDTVFEANKKFKFEEEVRNSLSLREIEYNEFSTVAFCKSCNKEIVTVVSYEKIKGESCGDITHWILCWAFPACMSKNKALIHQCPLCKAIIAQILC